MLVQLGHHLLQLLQLRHHRDLLAEDGLETRHEGAVAGALLHQHAPHRGLLDLVQGPHRLGHLQQALVHLRVEVFTFGGFLVLLH